MVVGVDCLLFFVFYYADFVSIFRMIMVYFVVVLMFNIELVFNRYLVILFGFFILLFIL